VQNTTYKTANLKVFTDYWFYPVSLFASIFPYSKQKSAYTCCLCEVHSVLGEGVASTSNCFVALRVRSQQLFCHRNSLVARAERAQPKRLHRFVVCSHKLPACTLRTTTVCEVLVIAEAEQSALLLLVFH